MPTLRGTAWQRPNGTWTVQGESRWDAAAGKHTRPILGPFATEATAREAQLQYTLSITQGRFSMGTTALLLHPIHRGPRSLASDFPTSDTACMGKPIGFALIVFVTTLVVNVAVVALWPDRSVDWLSSAVVAGTASVVLSVLYRQHSGRGS